MNIKDIPMFVVNLPHRGDRLQSVMKQFKKHNIHPLVWKATNGSKVDINPKSRKAQINNECDSGIIEVKSYHEY